MVSGIPMPAQGGPSARTARTGSGSANAAIFSPTLASFDSPWTKILELSMRDCCLADCYAARRAFKIMR